MKKTVWICNGLMNAGGTEALILNILRHRSENFDYILVIHTVSGKEEFGVWDNEIKKLNIPIYYLPAVGNIGIKKYCIAFKALADKIGKPDIMHCHLNAVGGIISYAAYKADVKARIVHCHANIRYKGSIITKLKGNIKLAISKRYIKKYATDRWACSKSAAKCLFGDKCETVVINNMINTDDYLPTTQKRKKAREKLLHITGDEPFIIGAIGRIARIKNYELVLRAIAECKNKIDNIHFVCYGRVQDKDYFNELQTLVNRLDISKNVHFLGNSTTVSQDIAAFDCFVMPSITEGFGIAALEAQAAGLPVIVSNGVPTDMDVKMGNVYYLPLDNHLSWTKAIEKTFSNFIAPKNIKEAFIASGFDAQYVTEYIEDKYCEIILRTTKGNK